MAGVYLGLGSNLGNRRANLAMAMRMLEPLCRVEAVSALYESAPQSPAPPPAYLNAACRVVTGLTPVLLLRHVKRIEKLIGRHGGERWAPRPIDIDILLYDDQLIDTPELTVPHPRLLERTFVLQPLLDLDAALAYPGSAQPLSAVLGQAGSSGMQLIAAPRWHARVSMPQ